MMATTHRIGMAILLYMISRTKTMPELLMKISSTISVISSSNASLEVNSFKAMHFHHSQKSAQKRPASAASTPATEKSREESIMRQGHVFNLQRPKMEFCHVRWFEGGQI